MLYEADRSGSPRLILSPRSMIVRTGSPFSRPMLALRPRAALWPGQPRLGRPWVACLPAGRPRATAGSPGETAPYHVGTPAGVIVRCDRAGAAGVRVTGRPGGVFQASLRHLGPR